MLRQSPDIEKMNHGDVACDHLKKDAAFRGRRLLQTSVQSGFDVQHQTARAQVGKSTAAVDERGDLSSCRASVEAHALIHVASQVRFMQKQQAGSTNPVGQSIPGPGVKIEPNVLVSA